MRFERTLQSHEVHLVYQNLSLPVTLTYAAKFHACTRTLRFGQHEHLRFVLCAVRPTARCCLRGVD